MLFLRRVKDDKEAKLNPIEKKPETSYSLGKNEKIKLNLNLKVFLSFFHNIYLCQLK
jgi:hypothetical protein